MVDQGSDVRMIVLVDRTDSLETYLGKALSETGFSVTTVSSGGACLSLVEAEDVAGIVCSNDLDDLDGLELLRSIRISHPFLPFVLTPRDGSETLAGDAFAAGASGYVPRDADPETVITRLRGSIERENSRTDEHAESHHRYRHLIENSPAPINIFDENGDSIWCNRALLDLFGFESRDEFIGRSIFEFIHPDDRERAQRELESVIGEKDSTGPTSMKLRTPDGSVKYIRVSTAIGSILGTDIGQAVAVDVTDREERERQLQILDQWLQHNIRNEVTTIKGVAENIQREATGDIRTSAETVQEHADRLVEQADHERSLTRILASTSDRTSIAIDIGRSIARQLEEIRRDRPNASIEFDRAVEVDVVAVPEIETAIGELIRNAIRHNDTDEPTVRISVERSRAEEECIIRVADNGPGIPAAERSTLVLEREIDELNHGSGLGLVLVYWVIRLSDGTIEFDENDPRGSVVKVSLPIADD